MPGPSIFPHVLRSYSILIALLTCSGVSSIGAIATASSLPAGKGLRGRNCATNTRPPPSATTGPGAFSRRLDRLPLGLCVLDDRQQGWWRSSRHREEHELRYRPGTGKLRCRAPLGRRVALLPDIRHRELKVAQERIECPARRKLTASRRCHRRDWRSGSRGVGRGRGRSATATRQRGDSDEVPEAKGALHV